MKLKTIFVLMLLFGGYSLMAQDNIVFSQDVFPSNIEKQSEFIKTLIPELQNDKISFQLRYFRQSRHSKHYTFDVYFGPYSVFSNFIKVNTNKANKIISVAKGIGMLQHYAIEQFNDEKRLWDNQKEVINHWPTDEIVKETRLAIFEKDEQASLVKIEDAWDQTYDKTKVINLTGEVIATWDHQRHFGIDTFINANVFSPDPLTFLNKTYGSPYVDSNDQDLPWMAAAYLPVNIPAVYDTFVNLFFIENDFAKSTDLNFPFIPASSSPNNNFYFNRSQAGFEECMIVYHINEFHNHLSAIGYDTLMDLQLPIDAHGQGNAENSSFNRNGGSPNMTFGDGGIDDGEDADVIIHEYGHGLSWSANENTHATFERVALDEGIGDYFATSYSRGLSSFNWQKIFNWDGNNLQWQGRVANTPTNYSNPFSGNIYSLGEVWNAAMQQIYTDLGRNVTDALMCETLFFLTDSTNLPSAAFYLLQADSLLFSGVHSTTICNHFQSKNLLSWQCSPTSINNQIIAKQDECIIKNSAGFSQGSGQLIITLPKKMSAKMNIFDLNGRLLYQKEILEDNFSLQPSLFNTGIYILRIQTPYGVQSFKLSRQ